jgi:hypothetical protein
MAAIGIVAAGILADTWVPGIPLGAVPESWSPPPGVFSAVLELPLGGTGDDVTAMYHTLRHHLPTINGYSGYAPPHYTALHIALEERDVTALDGLAARGPLLVAADSSRNGDWPGFVRRLPGATPLGERGPWMFFSIPRGNATPDSCVATTIPIVSASDNRGAVRVSTITDGNTATLWTLERPQHAGDQLTIDLGHAASPCEAVLHEDVSTNYPRALTVATSLDGRAWTPSFSGRTGGLAVSGALTSPRSPTLAIRLASTPARYIRFQLERTLERDWWIVTELAISGRP